MRYGRGPPGARFGAPRFALLSSAASAFAARFPGPSRGSLACAFLRSARACGSLVGRTGHPADARPVFCSRVAALPAFLPSRCPPSLALFALRLRPLFARALFAPARSGAASACAGRGFAPPNAAPLRSAALVVLTLPFGRRIFGKIFLP